MRPATPAALMLCPMLAFTEPTAQDPASPPSESRKAAISVASPTGVAVPWPSRYPSVRGENPASA
jgi:hypothetical protein